MVPNFQLGLTHDKRSDTLEQTVIGAVGSGRIFLNSSSHTKYMPDSETIHPFQVSHLVLTSFTRTFRGSMETPV